MFHDRVDAGRQLARKLAPYANREDVLVLGIPRGGVPVAFEVAQALHAPLDVLLVRKLGVPGERELAMGAIASGGARILNQRLIAELGVTEKQVAETIADQEAELQRREELYRGVRPGIPIQGRIIILVDDGIATGSSMLAAIEALRTLQPKKIVVAVPVAPTHAETDIGNVADEFICVDQPEWFYGIGQFYQDFSQTQDLEVRVLLERSAGTFADVHKPKERGAAMTTRTRDRFEAVTPVRIPIENMNLQGDLRLPSNPLGVVIFVHGSGSGRFSPRNRFVAEELNKQGFATLLLDLLTEEEHRIDMETMEYRFNIHLLASRSTLATSWVHGQPGLSRLPIGLFGASTGAAAALITAAEMKQQVAAVVSRGGRPDLAEEFLPQVDAPTLLIVGGEDDTVLALNKKAMAQMHCVAKLHVVPGATHLFEEPGGLEQVVTVAAEWFARYMHGSASKRMQRAAGE